MRCERSPIRTITRFDPSEFRSHVAAQVDDFVPTDHLERKRAKLLQYGERVWGVTSGTDEERMVEAIRRTREFFERVGVPTRLAAYGVAPGAVSDIPGRLERRGWVALGEAGEVTPAVVRCVLAAGV